jgi:hypothetical protein
MVKDPFVDNTFVVKDGAGAADTRPTRPTADSIRRETMAR